MKDRTRVFRLRPGDRQLLAIINPIYNAPSCWTAACHVHPKSQVVLGVLDVTMSLDSVEQELRRSQAAIAVFALSAIVALSLIVGVLVQRLVAAPVARLVQATRRVAEGDLAGAIPESGDDELGMLARSFNNMTRKLSETRQQLVQSDKLASLGRLAAGVAHEINNPLTGVLTYASFLLKRTKEQPEIHDDLQVIVRETLRSREIVKNLLDFARQSVPNKTQTDLNEIIGRAAAVVQNQFTRKNITLSLELDGALPKAVLDGNQMEQVIINLLVNAADAIGSQGGTIRIATSAAQAGSVELRVIDTGCGIAKDQLEKIFEPFYTTKGQQGTGLGLAVSWGIVDNHGGTIAVESAVGVGTTFIVRIPVKSA
jgi:two-component system NtrC family sensor kinase